MKHFKKIFIILLTFIVMPSLVSAASGHISVSSGSNVVVGKTVTVSVTLSSATSIGSWQMSLNYDRNYLQLTGSTAEAGGTRMASSSATGIKKKTYTFTFKALKSGTTKVNVDSYLAYAFDDLSEMSLSSGSKQIKIITQAELEASYSKDNNLKSLGVDNFTITPEFNANTTEYSAVVPEDTKEINIVATPNDSRSSITGVGVQSVTLGTNTFNIVVKAQNGAEKTYVLNVEVKDANPIEVTVNKIKYTVVKIRENLPSAPAYSEYTVKINDIEIPAYKNDNSKIVLVGLKSEDGKIALFMYDEKTNKFSKYTEIGQNKIVIYPLETTEKLKGYTSSKVNINGETVNGYIYNKTSNFVVIYGMNIETGEKGFYTYDKKNQNIMVYNDEVINDLNKKVSLYTYILIGYSAVLVLLLAILFTVIYKRKHHKKNKARVKEEK